MKAAARMLEARRNEREEKFISCKNEIHYNRSMQVSLIFGLVGRLARDSCEVLGQDRERSRPTGLQDKDVSNELVDRDLWVSFYKMFYFSTEYYLFHLYL